MRLLESDSIRLMRLKAFTLMETIIAISILSVIMVSLLQIKENNIFFLSKVEESTQKDMLIAIAAGLSDFNNTGKDEKLYLKDLITVKDDEIRKKIKDVSVVKKINEFDTLEFESDEFPIKVEVFEEKYTLKDGTNKNIYSFTME